MTNSKNSTQEKADARHDNVGQQSIPLWGSSFLFWTSESRPLPFTKAASVFITEVAVPPPSMAADGSVAEQLFVPSFPVAQVRLVLGVTVCQYVSSFLSPRGHAEVVCFPAGPFGFSFLLKRAVQVFALLELAVPEQLYCTMWITANWMLFLWNLLENLSHNKKSESFKTSL